MLTLKNVRMLDGRIIQIEVSSHLDHIQDVEGKLTVLPALVDTNFHLQNAAPIQWPTVVKAAIAGGITTLCCLPQLKAGVSAIDAIQTEKARIDAALAELKVPLKHPFYFHPDEKSLSEFGKVKGLTIGLALELNLDRSHADFNEHVLRLAAQEDLVVTIESDDKNRSKITKEAIRLAEKFGTQIYFVDVSTSEELELIRQARRKSLLVYTGVASEQLFDGPNKDALWRAITDGTIDTVGSGHGSHHLEGIQKLLSQLLNAVKNQKLKIEKLIALTSLNAARMFRLPKNEDLVLVDLEKSKTTYTILGGESFDCSKEPRK